MANRKKEEAYIHIHMNTIVAPNISFIFTKTKGSTFEIGDRSECKAPLKRPEHSCNLRMFCRLNHWTKPNTYTFQTTNAKNVPDTHRIISFDVLLSTTTIFTHNHKIQCKLKNIALGLFLLLYFLRVS